MKQPTMKLTFLLSILSGSASAFHVGTTKHYSRHTSTPASLALIQTTNSRSSSSSSSRLLSFTAETLVDDVTFTAKTDLLRLARRLKEENGVFIVDKAAQEELMKEAEKLEIVAGDPVQEIGQLVGDWELICTTASADMEGSPLEGKNLPKVGGIDLSKLPFYNQSPFTNIRNLLNRSVNVEQRIRNTETMTMDDGPPTSFDRIDHVIEYQPPSKLTEFLDNIPEALQSLNINPLEVSAGKVILIHKAAIESTIPNIKTKLSLSSVVVNVAGQSQILDPNGADLIGVNVPLGEFLNAGSFETTYVDDEIRISRSKVGLVEQLRLFVRKSPPYTTSATIEEEDTSEDSSEEEEEEETEDASHNTDVSPSDV